MYDLLTNCRSCDSSKLTDVLALGDVPLADGFVAPQAVEATEQRFPLTVVLCEDCSLMQLRETVRPEILFGSDYPYYSSFSTAWVDHCRANALELIESQRLNEDSLVVEIASNDGYLLRNFHERGIPVLGIDPVPGPAAAAERLGIRTCREFFGADLARQLAGDDQRADVVLGNNVLAHVADLSGFINGIRTVLKPGGVAVIEVPYVRDLIEHCEFDTIYHEHLCYFSVTSLCRLFNDRGLALADVRRLSTHGGSLRIYAEHGSANGEPVRRLLEEERALGLDAFPYYSQFAADVLRVQRELIDCLSDLAGRGKRVAAYGAAAKGTILLNSSQVEPAHLEFVVDRNVHKHGHFMPGVRIPICEPERLLQDQPDYVLLLAWNHKDEIIRQQDEYRRRGGRFIVPIPRVSVI